MNVVAVTVSSAVILLAYILFCTPRPPAMISAPEPVLDAAVELVIVIALVVLAPKSVTSCKSCNVGPGSYVGSD
jgi:hypothetical protein